jgi:hypothetical protein
MRESEVVYDLNETATDGLVPPDAYHPLWICPKRMICIIYIIGDEMSRRPDTLKPILKNEPMFTLTSLKYLILGRYTKLKWCYFLLASICRPSPQGDSSMI